MHYDTLTPDELERLAYMEPDNIAVQRALGQVCLRENIELRAEAADLEREVDELEAALK